MWFASQSPTILQFQLSSWQFSHIQTFTLVKEASLIKLSFRRWWDSAATVLYHPTVIQLLIECIHDFLFISVALRRHFCWEMFVLSSNTFFSSLVYVEGKFFSFSFTTWQEKMYAAEFFFHIFLLLSWKLFWFCCCCLVSSLVTWNAVCFFFGNWHQQSAPFSRTAKWLVIFISKNFKAKNLKTVNFCRDRKNKTFQFSVIHEENLNEMTWIINTYQGDEN